MIILEKPYISDCLLKYLETGIPVMENEMSKRFQQQGYRLNLLDEKKFFEAYKAKPSRLYSVSENALGKIYQYLKGSELVEKINIVKDKYAFRRICSGLYPDFFFKEVESNQLSNLDIADLKFPFVLKPSVGFLSVGVYIVRNEKDWREALDDINRNFDAMRQSFPDTVVQGSRFILEQYIQGEEYAVDAYFDVDKNPVILNIFHHRFASETDVSDRLYLTSKKIFDLYLEPFTAFLKEVNGVLGLRNFPLHIEFRVENGRPLPIEINPLRFAGMCLNELQVHISGLHPVKAFLEDIHPDYEAMWKGRETDVFSFAVIGKPADAMNKSFDHDAFCQRLSHVLENRKIEDPKMSVFALMFTQTDQAHLAELDWLLKTDLKEFIK